MSDNHAEAVETVTGILRDDGWTVKESFWTTDGEPLTGQPDDGDAIPTPDLYVADPTEEYQPRWVEVKWRKQAIVYEKEDERRHGIEIPEWDAHNDCQRQTGMPVWIFIIENNTATLLRQRVRSLDPVQITKKMWTDAGGAILFSRDDFEAMGKSRPFETDASVQAGLHSF